MQFIEIYFAFHRPLTIRELIDGKGDVLQMFGHVEAFGYTADETWAFFDPGRRGSKLLITHRYDEVEALMSEKFTLAHEVIRYSGDPIGFQHPFHGPMNCVTQCAALIGVRAFTPRGFRKKLLRNNAEVIKHGTERGSEGGTGPDEGASASPA